MPSNIKLEEYKRCTEFDKLRNERRDKTFPAFREHTDEKNQTIKVTTSFLNTYFPSYIKNITATISDWGVGDGELSSLVASYMNATFKNIVYEGIDRSIAFVNTTKAKLTTLGIKDNKIILGSVFNKDIEQLSDAPTLLIASQVIFYAPDINEFIEVITKKMGFVAIIIGQASGSILDYTTKTYDNSIKKTGTDANVQSILKQKTNFVSMKLLYSSIIEFPKRITYEELEVISLKNFDSLKGTDAYIRYLLEFIAGSPMEKIVCEGKIHDFLQDIINHKQANNGKISFWNFMSIIVPKEKMSAEEMDKNWHDLQKLYLSGNVTSFESAINEGNYEIVVSLFNQGLVSCELLPYKETWLEYLMTKFYSFCSFEARLNYDLNLIASLMQFELDNKIKFINFTHPAINKIKNTNTAYKYEILPELLLKRLENEPNYIHSTGAKYREKWGMLNSDYIFSFSLLAPPLLILDKAASSLMATSMIMLYFNIYIKFYNTNVNAISNMNSGDLIFHFFLFEGENVNSLKFQNSLGQTPLHLAILNSDSEKAFKLLCCNSSLVENLINIYDIQGKLPLHYAAELNDSKIAQVLLKKGANINAETFNPHGIWCNRLFLLAKLIYLKCYFNLWIEDDSLNNFIKASLIWPAYFILKLYDIEIPENIYFHSILLRLNQFGDENNYLYQQSEAYDEYQLNTPLHLACKKNHTEIVKIFLKDTRIEVNKLNIYGESPLHLAIGNANAELVNLLLENNADINIKDNSWFIQPIMLDYAIKTILIFTSNNSLLKLIGNLLLLQTIYDKILPSFNFLKGPTPLVYAVREDSKYNGEILDLLIERGADANIAYFKYDSFKFYQLLPYVITKGIIFVAKFYGFNINAVEKIAVLSIAQFAFSYRFQELRPIDLLQEYSLQNKQCIDVLYKPLKQYTVLNDYKSIDEFSYLQYFLYNLGLISDSDIIAMKEYGLYKGGSGKDIFLVYSSFIGKEEGYKLIIQDYSSEDIIRCKDCNYINIELNYIKMMNTSSTVLSINQELEIILLGRDITNIDEIILEN